MMNILASNVVSGWLGLNGSVWTVIAIIVAAVACVLVVIAIVTAHARKKAAELASAAEQAAKAELAATTEEEIEEDEEELSEQTEEEALAEEEEDETTEVETDDAPEGTPAAPKKLSPNFRMRLKESSDRNRTTYVALTNLFLSYKGVSYTMTKRLQRFKYEGEIIARIGVASRHIKLYLGLDPTTVDAEKYMFTDVSEKKVYEGTPVLVRIGTERALNRFMPLIMRLLEEKGAVKKARYAEKGLQELAYTLRRNALLRIRRKELLRESVHSHDAETLFSEEETVKFLEYKEAELPSEENYAAVSLAAINAKFLDGQRVNLKALKRAGLVKAEANGFTVTGGGILSKPLIVESNGFSETAVKMIVLTGGRAIQLVRRETAEERAEHALRIRHEIEDLVNNIRQSVTVEEAHSVLSDEAALTIYESGSDEEQVPDKAGLASLFRAKKYAVNVDTLSANYNAHDTVTLESLKEKGLVPPKAKGVKILARGTLNKPLIVEAQDFSVDAIKMILLCGGKAKRIIAEPVLTHKTIKLS